MQRVVRAFPVLSGQEAAARELAREMSTDRRSQAGAFYQQFGVTHECWFAQQTPQGLVVIAVTDFDGRAAHEAAAEYAQSLAEFDAWLKRRIHEISGIDPAKQPLGPPTECIFDWP